MVYLFLVLLVCLLIQSCKQDFPEGPSLSLRSAEARVVGNKLIESYVVDGIDSTFMFDSLLANTTFATKGFDWGDQVRGYSITCTLCYSGIWGLTEDGKQIGIYFPASLVDRFGQNGLYDILRLTEKELWVRLVDPARQIEIKFKKL